MKTTKKVLIGTFALLFLLNQTNAQSTQNGLGALGHTNVGGVLNYYLGWNAASTIPLNIEHRGTDNINFLNGPFPGTNRMTILGTAAGANAGFVGIGLPSPLYRLDVNDDINVNTNALNTAYRINGIPVLQIF